MTLATSTDDALSTVRQGAKGHAQRLFDVQKRPEINGQAGIPPNPRRHPREYGQPSGFFGQASE